MPRATVDLNATENFDLKSVEGGTITLRRMSYGQSVQRRAMMKLSFEASGNNSKDFKGEMAMASVDIQRYEFQSCIVDHNLTDENDKRLNLSDTNDMARLDPRVGQEIEELISSMNDFNEGEEGNSQSGASQS